MIAASLAFHGFLALLPVMIAAVGVLDLVGLSPAALHALLHATGVMLPNQMSSVLATQLAKRADTRVNVAEIVLGLAVALWSSVEAMSSMQVALDVAYEVPRDRGFLGRRLAAVPLLLVTLLLGGTASVLLILGGPISHLVPSTVATPLAICRYAGSVILVVLLLSLLYAFGPARAERDWELLSPGAVAAAIGWILSSLAFSFYLDHFGHTTRTDGGLAGVAVTLLWFFLTSMVILLGAELNRELERWAEDSQQPNGKAGKSPSRGRRETVPTADEPP